MLFILFGGHTGIISKETAEECTDKIIGKVDAYLHTATIRGLIMELCSYLK